MSTGTTEFVSILAGNYMQPLGVLIERLVAKPREGLPSIKANEHETDWAISSTYPGRPDQSDLTALTR